jgi:hypothetical protein
VGKFSLTDPSNKVALTTFEKIQLVCKVIALLAEPLPAPVVVPPAPPAITQQQCKQQKG